MCSFEITQGGVVYSFEIQTDTLPKIDETTGDSFAGHPQAEEIDIDTTTSASARR